MRYINEKITGVEYRKRPGAYVIITRKEDKKIAIVNENDKYFFLGGGIEEGETPLETLKRELIEECGYSIKNIRKFDEVNSYEFSNSRGYLDITANVYIGEFDEKITEPIEKDHVVLWIDPNEYVEKLYFNWHRYILRKYIETVK